MIEDAQEDEAPMIALRRKFPTPYGGGRIGNGTCIISVVLLVLGSYYDHAVVLGVAAFVSFAPSSRDTLQFSQTSYDGRATTFDDTLGEKRHQSPNPIVLHLSKDNDDEQGDDDSSTNITIKKKGVRDLVKKLFGGSKAESMEAKGEPKKTDKTTLSSAVRQIEEAATVEGEAVTAMDSINLAKTTTADAFVEAETDLAETDRTLLAVRSMLEEAESRQETARKSLAQARAEANAGLKAAEAAAAQAIAQAQRAESIIASLVAQQGSVLPAIAGDSTGVISKQEEKEPARFTEIDISSLSYEDVDYELHEMAAPFIDENQCLIPGETVVRVEKAPENSRRIFAGIDIMASVDDVWKVLTRYERLQDVVPNLVVNDVLERYAPRGNSPSNVPNGPTLSDEEQELEKISKQLRGAKLLQVGGAKVVGINFSARTTLEVREWPEGMPDFAHYDDEVYEGKSRNNRAKEGRGLPLKRYRFPRPFSLSSLPYRCVSMQSVKDDDGEFRMYQGVWRMQPLPGCSPPGGHAMRLTYAVEISPRPYLPVALVENRIARDLCKNLEAIRDFVS